MAGGLTRVARLVKETRETVDLFEWKDPEIAKDPEKYGREVTWRFHQIWDYDVQGMVDEAKSRLSSLLEGNSEQ